MDVKVAVMLQALKELIVSPWKILRFTASNPPGLYQWGIAFVKQLILDNKCFKHVHICGFNIDGFQEDHKKEITDTLCQHPTFTSFFLRGFSLSEQMKENHCSLCVQSTDMEILENLRNQQTLVDVFATYEYLPSEKHPIIQDWIKSKQFDVYLIPLVWEFL